MAIRNGQIVKVTRKEEKDTITLLGVILNESDVMTEKGNIWRMGTRKYSNTTVEVSATRNVNPDVRKILTEMYDLHYQIIKLEHQRDNLNRMITETRASLSKTPDKIIKAYGLLTYNEFIDEFYNNLSSYMKSQMKAFGYKMDAPCGIGYHSSNINIGREESIQKYCRKASFVYEEYDGTIHMCSKKECSQDPSYNSIFARYSHKLPTKYNMEETLSLGDKDWLIYSAMYSIEVTKPRTKEYAKELAIKFCH